MEMHPAYEVPDDVTACIVESQLTSSSVIITPIPYAKRLLPRNQTILIADAFMLSLQPCSPNVIFIFRMKQVMYARHHRLLEMFQFSVSRTWPQRVPRTQCRAVSSLPST